MADYAPPPDPQNYPLDTVDEIVSFFDEIRRWGDDMVRQLEERDAQQDQPAQIGYLPTNVSIDREFDADTVVITELADVLGTLIEDLKGKGIIG